MAGVAASTVQAIWKAHGLSPHRWRHFKLSNDPAFAEKLTTIVGLYVDPPAHAVVLSVDESELVQVGSPRYGPMQAPASAVVDTMEALMDADSGDFKRLHESVDSGFIYVAGTYTGESVRRRRDESGLLVDTNDTGADFEVITLPEPGVALSR